VQAVIKALHERWPMEQWHHGRYVREVNREQAGKEFWFREVIGSLDGLHTIAFPLGLISQKNAKQEKRNTYGPKTP
jgi:hypothetical protein